MNRNLPKEKESFIEQKLLILNKYTFELIPYRGHSFCNINKKRHFFNLMHLLFVVSGTKAYNFELN